MTAPRSPDPTPPHRWSWFTAYGSIPPLPDATRSQPTSRPPPRARDRPPRLRAEQRPGPGPERRRACRPPGRLAYEATRLPPVVLLGNSFGCQVAVDLAVRYPDRVRALVLVGPTIDPAARTAFRQILRWLGDTALEDPLQLPILARDLRDAGPRRGVAGPGPCPPRPDRTQAPPDQRAGAGHPGRPGTHRAHGLGSGPPPGCSPAVSWPFYLAPTTPTTPPPTTSPSCS